MMHHAVVPGSAPRDDADTRGAITVDGNTLARIDPVDDITAAVKNPDPPQIARPTRALTANESHKYLEVVLGWHADINSAQDWISLHVNAKNEEPTKNGGKTWVVGWPFKTIDDVVNCLDARVAGLLQR
jgi:hypothetical protein